MYVTQLVRRESGEGEGEREISGDFSAAVAAGVSFLDVTLSNSQCDLAVLVAVLRVPCKTFRLRTNEFAFPCTPEAAESVTSALGEGIAPRMRSFTMCATEYSSLPFSVLVLAAIAECDFAELRKVSVTGFGVKETRAESAARVEMQAAAEAHAIAILTKNRHTLRVFTVDRLTPAIYLARLRCPLLRGPPHREGFMEERERVLAFLGKGREGAAVGKFTERDGDGAMAFRMLGFIAGNVCFF
jgi:hypothetical protein